MTAEKRIEELGSLPSHWRILVAEERTRTLLGANALRAFRECIAEKRLTRVFVEPSENDR